MPPLPKLGQGVKGGAGALPNLPASPFADLTPPQTVGRVQPQPSAQPLLPLPAPMIGGSHFPTPDELAYHQLQQNPPRQLAPQQIQDAINASLDHGGPPSVDGQPITPLELQISGFQPHTTKLQQITGEVGHQLAGLGPGLVKVFGEDLPTETYNMIAHPGDRGPGMRPLSADLAAMGKNFEQSLPVVGHPGRQWQQDPASLIENWLTLPFLGAGAYARTSELGRVGEVARARGVSVPQQIATTLLRPQPQVRSLGAQFGGDTARGPSITNQEPLPTDSLSTPLHAFKSPTPEELKQNPWMGKIVADYNPKTGKFHFGAGEHDDLWQRMAIHGEGGPNLSGTVILDPDTGLPVRFNLGKVGISVSKAQAKLIEANGLAEAQHLVEQANRLPGGRVEGNIDASGISDYPQTQDVTTRGPDVQKTPFTLTPPAYKSALGGLAQKHVLDPLLEHHLNNPPSTFVPDMFHKLLSSKGIATSAANRFGRKARIDLENDIRTRAGGLKARMPEELANGLARGTAFLDRWDSLHRAGATAEEAAAQPWRDWTAVRPVPSDIPRASPEFLTPKQIQAHSALSINSDEGLARQFTSQGRMVPSEAEIEANPGDFHYVPTDLIRSMQTYTRGTGTAARALNTIDRGTQIIRSGRFLTPAYAQWAIQNGLIHTSQAGAFVFRNVWQLRNEFPKAPAEVQGAIDGGTGKGIARATEGGEAAAETWIAKKTRGAREFWHKFDDQWARRMSAIHELNSYGYHNANAWTKLYRRDPERFRMIVGGQGNREAINYTEMTPAERGTLQKLMTAYGWTRGATTYTARFPLQHPVQAAVGLHVADIGEKTVDDFYKKLGGMVPEYLREGLPFGGNKLLQTQMFSPTGTAANLLGETPGATFGQTQSWTGELAPVPSALLGLAQGMNQYGTPYKGNERVTGPITGMLNRFKPLGAVETALQTKKGGTFEQSPLIGAEKFVGVPTETLRNPTQTAGLGEKDFEQSLGETDKIHFQYQRALQNLPVDLTLYQHTTGQAPPPELVQQLTSDLKNVEQRDLFQYHYASVHGSKSWKALPPANKLQGTLDWLKDHGAPAEELQAAQTAMPYLTNDKEIEAFVNQLWQGTGIGATANEWKTLVKTMKLPQLTKPNS